MALQISSEFSGIDLPAAYARIRYVTMDAAKAPLSPSFKVHVEVFASKAASDTNKPPVSGMDFTFQDWDEVTKEVEKTVDGDKKKEIEVVKEKSTAFSDFFAKIEAGGDPRAAAYTTIAARPEFADAKSV